MSLAHTSPSLRSRIYAAQHGLTTIPAGPSGVRPPVVGSYSERYRGTQYSSYVEQRPVRSEPRVSNGRLFVLLSGAAVTTVLVASAMSVLG
jgi:hypothetical protein